MSQFTYSSVQPDYEHNELTGIYKPKNNTDAHYGLILTIYLQERVDSANVPNDTDWRVQFMSEQIEDTGLYSVIFVFLT